MAATAVEAVPEVTTLIPRKSHKADSAVHTPGGGGGGGGVGASLMARKVSSVEGVEGESPARRDGGGESGTCAEPRMLENPEVGAELRTPDVTVGEEGSERVLDTPAERHGEHAAAAEGSDSPCDSSGRGLDWAADSKRSRSSRGGKVTVRPLKLKRVEAGGRGRRLGKCRSQVPSWHLRDVSERSGASGTAMFHLEAVNGYAIILFFH